MITNKKQIWKSIFIIVFAFTLSFLSFTTCMKVDQDIAKSKLSLSHKGEITFSKDGGSKTIQLESNRGWKATKGADVEWIKVSPTSGQVGTTTITVDVKKNNGEPRNTILKITGSEIEKTITIAQEGEEALPIEYATIKEIRAEYIAKGQAEWTIAEPLMLKGVVVSDRVGANRASQRDGFIQDEEGYGLAFRVNQSIHSLDMGDALNVNLEGATLLYYGGILQLNFSTKNVEVETKNVVVSPKVLTIEEILHGMHDATLVKIKDVQFKDYDGLNYWDKGIATTRTIENCNNTSMIVKTTKNANFKDETLPAGKGHLIGIASLCNDDWQLVVRNITDAREMSHDESTRCKQDEPPVVGTKISIADFRAAHADGKVYTKEHFIEGEVTLNAYKGNVPDNVVYLADKTAGIVAIFSDKENILTNVPIGAKVRVRVKDTKAKVLNGLLQIGVDNTLTTQAVEVVETKPSTPLQPKVATIGDVLAGKYQSEIVTIANVQFKEEDNKYADNPFVINKDKQEVQVYTRRDATFASEAVKKGMGTIVAVVSIYNSPQLVIKSVDDLAGMTGVRFDAVPSFIKTDKDEIIFENEGGKETINITANVEWTARSDQSWLTITPLNGKNDGAIIASISKNESTERKGSITISDGVIYTTIQVAQKAKEAAVVKYTTIKEIRAEYIAKGQAEWTIAEPLMLKGVVVSDRVGANRASQRDGFIQDEEGYGLAFRVNQSIHSLDMGDALNVNLEGATLLYYGGILQLNFSTKNVEVETKNVVVSPKVLTIEEILHGMHDATLVKIKDVQFKDYDGLNYWDKGIATTRTIENCNNTSMIVKTTKNANFKDETLPAGKGHLIGIASLCNDDWQLVVRNITDAREMSHDESTRCKQDEPPVVGTKISIADFRAAHADGKVYTKEHFIEGEVTLNAYKGNVPDNVVYLADKTAGIVAIFSDKENILTNVPIGAKVRVRVKDTKAKVLNGLLQIGVDNTLTTQAVEVVETKPSTPLQPKVATIGDVLAGKYQSEIVTIANVQFKVVGAKYADSPYIINTADKEVQVYTRGGATFANEVVKGGMGAIVTVVSVHNSPQLLVRTVDDLADMVGERFDVVPPFIEIEKSDITFENKGGDATINITANVEWTARSDQSWLTITPLNGKNDGAIIASVSKNESAERKSSITISDGVISRTIQVTQEAQEANDTRATDLFFSEYIEGSSYNKYLEIYNGTGRAVDLSDYKIEIYVNGQTIAKYTEELSGILKDGAVIVLQHPKSTIYDGLTIESSAINFNGNDAITLVKISTDAFVDIFGSIGEDPGKAWTTSISDVSLTTLNSTLVRKASIRGGVTVNPENGFPTLGTEWIMCPEDTIDYLGSHTMN